MKLSLQKEETLRSNDAVPLPFAQVLMSPQNRVQPVPSLVTIVAASDFGVVDLSSLPRLGLMTFGGLGDSSSLTP